MLNTQAMKKFCILISIQFTNPLFFALPQTLTIERNFFHLRSLLILKTTWIAHFFCVWIHYTAHFNIRKVCSAPFVWTLWIGNFCSREVFSSERYNEHATSHFYFGDKMLQTRYNSNIVCVCVCVCVLEQQEEIKLQLFDIQKERLSGILKST